MRDCVSMRVFVGPCEVAGYYFQLVSGLRAIGVDCDFVELSEHKFSYHSDKSRDWMVKMYRALRKRQALRPKRSFIKVVYKCAASLLRKCYFLKALVLYDVFIFGYGDSMLRNNADLPILRFLGKRIIVNIGHGSEARPPYLDGYSPNPCHDEASAARQLADQSRVTAKRVKRVEKWASVVIGMPLSTSQFAQRHFVNWFALGIPYKGASESDLSSHGLSHAGEIQILHCPSHPVAKGTEIIRSAVSSLKVKDPSINYIELSGRPNEEIIAAIQRCDVVVDQVYSDTPLAGLGTEAAWYGKPTLVGGYGFNNLAAFVRDDLWPPSYTCHPRDLGKALDDLVADAGLRRRIGQNAATFLRQKWSAIEVAQKYVCLIKGEIPNEWLVDPSKVVYHYGACQNIEMTKDKVRALVRHCGASSLQLDHKPFLKADLLELCGLQQR